ncbi:hypothetical protein [Sphingobacterium bovistauri]|uniref:Carboxypeptidase-like regulatory domain-containing protein n=1 Tax=Sphingobacterium bovistauri TaxID=2781959 RepID=A0ABS7Z5G8_9SPHI|nr:hypothetical protein [Sphingobacterium bovistauri]MCA5004817.1 hypothetical protein [Sphingobacterium bovistauri]
MKINIPNPCREKYDSMSPTDLGRMCKVCNTEVVDFTNWKTKDIVNYIQKSNQKVCGKLKPSLLEKNYSIRGINWLAINATLLLFGSWITIKAEHKLNSKLIYESNDNQIQIHNAVNDSIQFIFKDTKGKNIPGVILKNIQTNEIFTSDINGIVILPSFNYEKNILKASCNGYQFENIQANKKTKKMNIVLRDEDFTVGSVEFNYPLKHRIKRFFNIFSIKDEE